MPMKGKIPQRTNYRDIPLEASCEDRVRTFAIAKTSKSSFPPLDNVAGMATLSSEARTLVLDSHANRPPSHKSTFTGARLCSRNVITNDAEMPGRKSHEQKAGLIVPSPFDERSNDHRGCQPGELSGCINKPCRRPA